MRKTAEQIARPNLMVNYARISRSLEIESLIIFVLMAFSAVDDAIRMFFVTQSASELSGM